MTFDCGVTREMGEDPIAVRRWLAERDRINHVHFRNVVVRKQYVDYTEVFLDNGEVDGVRGDEETGAPEVPARPCIRSIRARSTWTARSARSAINIPAAADSRAKSTTSATPGR